MKKRITIFSLLFVLLIGNSDAQWYQKYGATDINDLTEEQLTTSWVRYRRIQNNIGLTFMIVGTAAHFGGKAMVNNSSSRDTGGEIFANALFGSLFYLAGLSLVITGTTIWLITGVRKLQIRSADNFKRPKILTLNISPSIDYNNYTNTYSTGFTFTLGF